MSTETDWWDSGGTSGPTRRRYNPLSKLSSYNYLISLHILSPEAYSYFIDNGGKNIAAISAAIPGGVYTIVQTGGISENSGEVGARGLPLDVYIDDLKIVNAIMGAATSGMHNLTNMTFTIIEPNGFQFVSRLRVAAERQLAASKIYNPGPENYSNPSQQHFILGIGFTGYKPDGTPATPSDLDDMLSAQQSGAASIGAQQNNLLFETYYPIFLTEMKYKLDGKGTTRYDIKAAVIHDTIAFGTRRGFLKNGVRIVAETVEEAFEQIVDRFNSDEEELYNTQQATSISYYSIIYKGPSGWEDKIKTAKLVNDDIKINSPDQLSMRFVNAARTSGATALQADRNTTPEQNKREINFRSGISVNQVLTSVIQRSSYVLDALNVKYSSDDDANNTVKNDSSANGTPVTPFIWFNISPVVTPSGFCKRRNTYTYNITYIVQAYETPDVLGSPIDKLPPYPGPHKVYDYWYTGKNTEIIQFEQSLDNNYYMTTYTTPDDIKKYGGILFNTGLSNNPIMLQSSLASDSINITGEPQNSFVNYLLDPKVQVDAKIQILGDPDYLMVTNPFNLTDVYRRFYGVNDYTINANGGQVFIELAFREPVDWGANNDLSVTPSTQPGLLTVSDAINFFFKSNRSQMSDDGPNRISYRLKKVTSTFSGGKFTQLLEGVLNTLAHDKNNLGKGNSSNAGTLSSSNARNETDTNQSTEIMGPFRVSAGGRGYVNPPLVVPATTSARPAMTAPSPTAPNSLTGASRAVTNIATDSRMADARRPVVAPSSLTLPVLTEGVQSQLNLLNPRLRR